MIYVRPNINKQTSPIFNCFTPVSNSLATLARQLGVDNAKLEVYNAKSGTRYWRASGASETLSGVTQLKIGDVCYRASEASEVLLVVCLSTNGERALNYTIVIHTTKIKSSC